MKHDYKFDGKEWVDAVEARCLALHSELTEANRKIAALQQAIDNNYIRIDDPVVTGLVDAILELNEAGGYIESKEFAECCHCNASAQSASLIAHDEGCLQPMADKALSAYEARVKEVAS